MTGARKQPDQRSALRLVAAPLALCLGAATPMPGAAAEALPPTVEAALQPAAERDADGPWLHKGKASVDYLRNRTQTQEQAFEGPYEAQYQLDARNFSSGLAHYEDDRFSGFDYEFTSSVGLGRHLVNDPGHAWTVTLGPSLRLAQPSSSDDQDRALGARFTNLLSWELSDTAKQDNETEALADQERVRVNNDVVLKLRIIDQLSGQISFGFEYRSDTPDGAEHTDTTTRAAVVYDF